MTIVVRRCETYTEVLNFLLEVEETYNSGDIADWKSEIYYVEDDDVYKVRIKLEY